MAFERLTDSVWEVAALVVSGVTGKKTRVEKMVEIGVFNAVDGSLTSVTHPTVIVKDDEGDRFAYLTGLSPTDEVLRTGKSVIIKNFHPQKRVTRRLVTGE